MVKVPLVCQNSQETSCPKEEPLEQNSGRLNFLCVVAFHRKSFRDHPTTSTPASKLQKLNPKQQHLFLLL